MYIKTPKYNRDLKIHEETRFYELVSLYEKLYSKPYLKEIINEKSNETLMDIACSKNRYEWIYKYFQEKRKEKFEENQKKEIKKWEMSVNDLKLAIIDLILEENNIDTLKQIFKQIL